jgi:hypothetical protein
MTSKRRKCFCLGFGFVETVFSILLVGGVMVAALNTVGASITGRKIAVGWGRGQLLAESLMTEILAQPYTDEDKLGTLGLETGETDVHRKRYDDVDDYRNFVDSPPKSRDGTSIPGLTDWSRTVSVVRAADTTSLNTLSAAESGLKRIKITVKCGGTTVATLVAFKTSTDAVTGSSKQISAGVN